MSETLYGRHPVFETLCARRRRFQRLLLADTVRPSDIVKEILARAEAARVPIVRVPRQDLEWLGEANHQGVALEASPYPYVELDEVVAEASRRGEPPFLLLLDLLEDVQNVGSLLRTAEAVGVHGAILQERRAAGVTPAVVRASAGAVEHMRVAQVTNVVRAMEELQAGGIWLAGLESASGAQRYDRANLSGALALVVGSEGKGLRRLVRERCDLLVELPMRGRVPSLNAAVAGSVVLYEAWRQRQARLTA